MNLNNLGLTERELDFLQTIYDISQEGWQPRVNEISKILKVRPSTSEEYLDHLVEKGFILKKSGSIRILEKGEEVVKTVKRNHRIVETFLYMLGMDLENSCKNAKQMEYHVTEEFIDSVCTLLGHPSLCPHGKEIPHNEECRGNVCKMELVSKE